MNRLLPLLFLGLTSLLGCGGELAPDDQEGKDAALAGAQASQPGAPRPAQPDGTSPDLDATTPATCSEAEQGQVQGFESEAKFRESITGLWMLCSSESVFCSDQLGMPLERGLEIEAGGRWYKIYEQSGKLVRGQGFDQQGTWEAIDTSAANGFGVYQLNLNVDGGGTVIVHPAIAIGPRKMRLNNMGVCVGDYAMAP